MKYIVRSIPAFIIAASYGALALNERTVTLLGTEDGLFEYLTAFFFLASSAIFFYSFVRLGSLKVESSRKRGAIFFLLLAIAFFIGFGEELSWGQRILKTESPHWITEMNAQKEMNIHNLKIFNRYKDGREEKSWVYLFLNFDRLFSLFWLSYCFMIPLLSRGWKALDRFVSWIQLPVAPVWVAVYFPLNYALSKFLEIFFKGSREYLYWPNTEIKEFIFSFLFFYISLVFIKQMNYRTTRSPLSHDPAA